MSASDNTEKILRGLHVMLSRSPQLPGDQSKVIVDREGMIALLKELNKCIYAMMDEYEMTRRSRDAAEREFQKQGDEIIHDANIKAEDIYAASVMFTEEALNNIQDIISQVDESVQAIYAEMEERLRDETYDIRKNQLELKAQLQDLIDTDKYMKLIEERNHEIQREKEEKEDRMAKLSERNRYADRQTEVRINKDVLERMGISIDEGDEEEITEEIAEGIAEEVLEAEAQIDESENILKQEVEEVMETDVFDLNAEMAAEETKQPVKRRKKKQSGEMEVVDLAAEGEVRDIKKKFGVKKQAQKAKVHVNYDSDYFKWRAEQEKLTKKEAAKAIREEKRQEFAQESDAQRELSEGIHELMKGFSLDEE